MASIFAKPEDKVAYLNAQAAKASIDAAKYAQAGDDTKANAANEVAKEAKVASAQMNAQIAQTNK